MSKDQKTAAQKVSMIDIGNLHRFGFRIGPLTEHPDLRDVSIFINGEDVSRFDRSAHVPSYVGGLTGELQRLTKQLNFLRYADRFQYFNLTQIHNMLLHGDPEVFTDETDWSEAADFHRFLQLNEPNTDWLTAFLIPSNDGKLALTYQYHAYEPSRLRRDVIDGVLDVLPYELIRTIRLTIEVLAEGCGPMLSKFIKKNWN